MTQITPVVHQNDALPSNNHQVSAMPSSYWSVRRFEVLYRDVVVPLLRHSDFQRQKEKTLASNSILPQVNITITEASSFMEAPTPGRRRPGHEETSPLHAKKTSATLSNISEEVAGDELSLEEDPRLTSLWDSLIMQRDYFTHVLGQTCDYSKLKIKGDEVWAFAGPRDYEFDKNQLHDVIEIRTPELLRVGGTVQIISSENQEANQHNQEKQAKESSSSLLSTLDKPDNVNHREAIVNLLIQILSSRLNLHQVECLHLLTVNTQLLHPELPPALAIESCATLRDSSSSLIVSSVGYMLLESCSTAFRREQLYHLWCLSDLAIDIYPLDEPGVEMSDSVSLAPMAFYQEIIRHGFFDNLLVAMKLLLFESTRHRAEFPSFGSPLVSSTTAIPVAIEETTDRMDRSWTRRLAQIAGRLLFIIVARFHIPPTTLFAVAELLGGSVFDETSIRRLGREFSKIPLKNGNSDDPLEDQNMLFGGLVTSKEFDMATMEDSNGTTGEDPLLLELKPSRDVLDITSVLTLVMMNVVDPTIVKWTVDITSSKSEKRQPNLRTVEFPTARLAEWLSPRQRRDSNASTIENGSLPTTWLYKRSANHDIETFWDESSSCGRLLSFAVSVAYTKPSDTRRFQLSLSSSWDVFHMIKIEFLDRLGGNSPLSKIALHTLTSLLEQTLLPINTQWAQLVRTDRLSRQAKRKNRATYDYLPIFSLLGSKSTSSYLTPIIALLNRLCAMNPAAVSTFGCLFFAVVETFPWHELASHTTLDVTSERQSADNKDPYSRSSITMSGYHQGGTESLCELYGGDDDEIPGMSGVGLPTMSRTSVELPTPSIDLSSQSFLVRPSAPQTETTSTQVSLVQKSTHFEDLEFLFPLFIEVVRFGATITAVGHRAIAVQVTSKLTTQPSLVLFFIPQTLEKLMTLFDGLVSGRLQTELLSLFSEQRRTRALRLRRGEFGPGYGDGSAFQFIDEDDEAEDRRLQLLMDQKFSYILGACGALFRFLVASFSPRLFLTVPPPPSLLAEAPLAVRLDRILAHAHSILKASGTGRGIGVGDIGAIFNGLHLIELKSVVIDGLASGFEGGGTGASHVFIAFTNDVLPIISNDLLYLSDLILSYDSDGTSTTSFGLPSQGEDERQKTLIKTSQHPSLLFAAKELLGRLSISLATYLASFITRIGYRYRYTILSPTIFEDQADNTDAFNPSTSIGHSLLTATRFVSHRLVPLLDNSCQRSLLPMWHFWRLASTVLKFLRCVTRGPLPVLGLDEIDTITQEPFLPPNHQNRSCSIISTDWLMRSFLSMDSLALGAVMLLARAAWQELCTPWDPAENSVNLFQLQVVETSLDILRLLFQRDTLFMAWWDIQRTNAVRSAHSTTISAASWDFISGLAPVHEHLMRDGSRVKPQLTTSSVSRLAPTTIHPLHHPTSVSSDSVPHAMFILELTLSEKHRHIRKKGLYLLQQLNCREPTKIAALFRESPYHLGQLQATMATIMRDLELEEFEKWEYLDNLGIQENGDFPIVDCPETLLMPLWSDESDSETDVKRSSGLAKQDALTVWETPDCLEVATFKDEIGSVDFPSSSYQHEANLNNHFDLHSQRYNQQPHRPTPMDHHYDTHFMLSPTLTSTTSKYTGLPLHQKLERRVNSVEDAACMAVDILSWFAFVRTVDPSPRLREYVNTAFLQDFSAPPSFFLLPFLPSRTLNNPSDNILSSSVNQLRVDSRKGTLSALGHYSPFEATTSRYICLAILKQSLNNELRGNIPLATTGLLLLGLGPSVIDQQPSTAPIMTTEVPLPYIPSPYQQEQESEQELGTNIWLRNSMLVLDSVFLIIEDVEPWVGESYFNGNGSSSNCYNEADNMAATTVNSILQDPVNYTDSVLRLYDEGVCSLLCLELLILMITHKQTSDVILHLLFVRLPHRHQILSQMLTTCWNTQPPLLRSINKLLFSSWAQLLASECHLCSTFLKSYYGRGQLPSWIRCLPSSPELSKTRTLTLRNQCQQVLEATLALLLSPIGSINLDLRSWNVPCSEATSTLLACSLSHLVAAESNSVLPSVLQCSSKSSVQLSVLLNSSCRSLSFFHRRILNSIQNLQAPLLDPLEALLFEKLGFLIPDELSSDTLVTVYDFNLRSLSILAAHRVVSRLDNLYAGALQLIITELGNFGGSNFTSTKIDLPSLVLSVIDSLDRSISTCIDSLELSSLESGRSRYCLISIMNSLTDAIIALLLEGQKLVTKTSMSLGGVLPLSRASLKSMIIRLIRLCTSSKSDNCPNGDSYEDGVALLSESRRIELPLRLTLYGCMSRVLLMGKRLDGDNDGQLLEDLYTSSSSNSELIDILVIQLLDDLLERESPDLGLEKSKTHNALIRRKLSLNSQDDRVFKYVFSSLLTEPKLTAAPLLKLIVDACASLHKRTVARGLPRGPGLSSDQRRPQPASQWVRNGVLDAINLWISKTLKVQYLSDLGQNEAHCLPNSLYFMSLTQELESTSLSSTIAATESVEVLPLIYSIIAQLAEHPSLCEGILAPSIPLPVSTFQHRPVIDTAMCRNLLIHPPALPSYNDVLSPAEFGFYLSEECMNNQISKSSMDWDLSLGSRQTNFIHRVERWSKVLPKPISVIILPFYMMAIHNVLSHLRLIDINFNFQMPNGVTLRIPASLAFLRVWLNKDRQLTSSLHCLLTVFNALKSDFPAKKKERCSQVKWSEESSSTSILNLADTLGTLKLTPDPKAWNDITHKDSWNHGDDANDNAEESSAVMLEDTEIYDRVIEPIKQKLGEIIGLIEITSRVWSLLLNLLLTKLKENCSISCTLPSTAASINIHPSTSSSALLTVDETLLIFGVQERMVQVALLLCELTTTNILHKSSLHRNMQWPENVQILLRQQYIAPELLSAIMPGSVIVRQICVDVLSSIGYEFQLYNQHLTRSEEQPDYHYGAEQQIGEQLKRSLIERTRSLIQIVNSSMLGLLHSVPLNDKRLLYLNGEIESFTGISRHDVKLDCDNNSYKTLRLSTTASSEEGLTVDQAVEHVLVYLRLLGLALPLLSRGLEMIFRLKGIGIGASHPPTIKSSRNTLSMMPPVENFTTTRQNALVCHTLASIHPSLVSGVTLKAIKLCAKACGSITEVSGFLEMIIEEIANCQRATPSFHLLSQSQLIVALKLVCIELLQLYTFLSQCVV